VRSLDDLLDVAMELTGFSNHAEKDKHLHEIFDRSFVIRVDLVSSLTESRIYSSSKGDPSLTARFFFIFFLVLLRLDILLVSEKPDWLPERRLLLFRLLN